MDECASRRRLVATYFLPSYTSSSCWTCGNPCHSMENCLEKREYKRKPIDHYQNSYCEKIDRHLKWIDEKIQEMKQRMNNTSIRQQESSLIQHIDEVIHSLRQGNNHQVINENTMHQVSHLVNRVDIMEAEECSNTIMMYSDFESNIDIGDYREEWNINVSPFEEPLHIPVTSQVKEDVVDSNTSYHPTISQEPIFSSIMNTKLLDHEGFFVFLKDGEVCLDSLEELVSYIE
ncbi:hypothetical protein Tco_1577181 [Tanacetum coccineum]